MTKQELERKINWDEYGIGSINIDFPLFNKEVVFELFSNDDDENPSVTDKMFLTLKDVLNLPSSSIEQIKNLLWEECNFSFTVSDYGCEAKDGETLKEAHFREFEINDKQDAFVKSKLKGVQINFESDKLKGRYAEISIDSATDNLISIIVKNGRIIDYDDDGTCLDWFDDDEQYAHNCRVRVLNGTI